MKNKIPNDFLEIRYSRALREILKWNFATDGRKWKGDHKTVLKMVMKIAKDAVSVTVGEQINAMKENHKP